MRITVYRDTAGFNQLASEWDALLHDSRANIIFMTHIWQTAWWQNLGEGDLMILAVRDDGGTLAGLAPLFRMPHAATASLNTVGCVDVSDYLDWIARRGTEDLVYAAVFEILGNKLADEWHELRLCNIPDGSPTLEIAPEQWFRHGQIIQKMVCSLQDSPAARGYE